MFEDQYNDEMEMEVKQNRATIAGHPEWINACIACGCELDVITTDRCKRCK